MQQLEPKYDIAAGDHRKILEEIERVEGNEEVVLFIKTNMQSIIEHYITCTWGVCYTTKFKELICPYFDDAKVLDNILRSEVIMEKENLIHGKTGAKIFPDLLNKLQQCSSKEIRSYLKEEF